MLKKILSSFLILIILSLSSCAQQDPPEKNKKFQFGADRLIPEYSHLIENKKLGIVTNHTAILSDKTHLVEELLKNNFNIVALFGPEHGILGKSEAGKKIENEKSQIDTIPVYSLYGKNKKPTTDMLKNVEVLIFDMQDIGARFYTYISTLYYVLQSAAENKIPVIVLDRPDPINGIRVEGPVLEKEFRSFIGIAKLPIRHGMTIGEIANYFVEENLIETKSKPDLNVIKLNNWKRENYYDDYFDFWINPSPNIPDLETAIIYPATCLIEGTNISEGRGTDNPFKIIGAPFINSDSLISKLNSLIVKGVELTPVQFTPEDIKGTATNPKFEHEVCSGIKISVIDRNEFNSVEFGINLIYALHKLYPDQFEFRENHFDLLTGNHYIRRYLEKGLSPEKIIVSFKDKLKQFISIRKKYLLY